MVPCQVESAAARRARGITGGGVVGAIDLAILNDCVGSADPDCCIADLDLDGEVTESDRALVWSGMIQTSGRASAP